ncbi:hypothetical protein [Nocardia sp. NPDC058666]|uniref:hypothetical protein n=1 Tax=unclassified Nocardia TaxID=2637762 RepID=UPI0036643919
MNSPLSGAEELSSWQLRLLERIQNISVEHTRVVIAGHPRWSATTGTGDMAVQTWRTHLRALEGDRAEIALHAAAVGVPQRWIDHAREFGARGVRWGEDQASDQVLMLRTPEETTRAQWIEGIAADVWQLEHMALVRAEHLHRVQESRLPDEEPALSQLETNMAALWTRAITTAASVHLTDLERAQLWERDSAGWQQLAVLTAASYTDAQLHERWRVFAWPGIERQANQVAENLVLEPGLAVGPPDPIAMVQRAETALDMVNIDQRVQPRHEHTMAAAVDAALPDDPETVWELERSGPGPAPAYRGRDLGMGL